MKRVIIPFSEKILFGQIPLFKTLSDKELDWLMERMETRNIPRRSMIYHPQDEVKELYIVKKGCIKLETGANDQKNFIKRLCFTGDIFGMQSFNDTPNRNEYAWAIKQDVWVFVIKIEDLKFLIRRNFDLQLHILQFLGNRIREAEKRTLDIQLQEATDRVVTFLNEMVYQWGQKIGDEWLINHQLTQEEIGAYVGAGRQVVTDVLSKLKHQQILHYSRGVITIKKLDRLVS